MTSDERKKLLGYGGLTRIAKRTRRSLSHVSRVNSERRDAVVERAIARAIVERNPDIAPAAVWTDRAGT